ncbi:hypothetical protein PFICI_10634 [Pestalotiopsis fici W106-1]|uniref:Amidoligase enzyme n=1 Tax=Pestalotiopsis fici (strain W106-1 / CGMCC3.15140) TaxID=1229662 RepID=W3WZK5_PESFW|nr:uncharacterized protein PFICI_10634 [Pestalotiopsis fici W106-1]ETS78572.1 hypothetical protein PFICI_10634 [Pestalotiopsis fici W106-1]
MATKGRGVSKASSSKGAGKTSGKKAPSKDSKKPPRVFPVLTKGIEFEFLVPWHFDVDEDGNGGTALAPDQRYRITDGYVIVARHTVATDSSGAASMSTWNAAMTMVRVAIYDVLVANGVQVNVPGGFTIPAFDPTHPRAALTRGAGFLRWNVNSDSSITTDLDAGDWVECVDPPQTEFDLADIELITPVLEANNAASDAEITNAIGILRAHFLCFTPTSSGLHVHVGQGSVLYEEEDLKRIAGVLFAIDVWFQRLHPNHRQNSMYCVSTRRKSFLAHGYTAKQAHDMEYGLLGNPFNNPSITPGNPAPDVIQAWKEIEAASDSRVVLKLLHTFSMSTYNFKGVLSPNKPTIEFRQAAGSLNAEWAVHWSNLAAGVVDWARRCDGNDSADELRAFLSQASLKESSPNTQAFSLINMIRDRFRLPAVADYLERVPGPDHRATPRATGQQARWRENFRRRSGRRLGVMRPRTDWPP